MRAPIDAADRREYLAFALGDERYGIEITRVREIRELDRVTRLVEAPRHVRGVVNLRGDYVVVTDLRTRFGMRAREGGAREVMIVIDGASMVGMVVDHVTDVVSLAHGEIHAPPAMRGVVDERFVRGIATIAQELLVVLDVEPLLEMAPAAESLQ